MRWYKCFPVLFLASVVATAQQPCGIFANREDFANNKVTYSFDNCQVDVRNNKDIVAQHRDHELRFSFDFIYGYSDGKDLYRAYGVQSIWRDHGYYKVIYEDDVIVYSRVSRDFRSNLQINYYFSLDKVSPIVPLRKKFYSYAPQLKGALQLDLGALRRHVGLPMAGDDDTIVIADAGLEGLEKKKPDISARLQTTTRRPKIF